MAEGLGVRLKSWAGNKRPLSSHLASFLLEKVLDFRSRRHIIALELVGLGRSVSHLIQNIILPCFAEG